MRHPHLFHWFVTTVTYCGLALFATSAGPADEAVALFAKVSGVASGDNITLFDGKKAYTVRLYGIRCARKDTPYGKEAREFMTQMVFGKTVEVRIIPQISGDKSSAVIAVQGQSLNEELLKRGLAWVNAPVCKEPVCTKWAELESQAKAERKGLWGEPGGAHPREGKRKAKKLGLFQRHGP